MKMYSSSESELLVAFGLRLKELRLSKRLSQEELADLTSLHRTYLGSAERGERNISLLNLYKLSAALNVSVAELLLDKK